jgi:hypothetical protein
MTIAEALDAFAAGWVAEQPVTPRIAYERTLRLLAFHLAEQGRSAGEDLDRLTPADLEAFVAWHAASGLADDADGSRKIALHVARLGAFLAERCGRPDLDLGRERLRSLVPGG